MTRKKQQQIMAIAKRIKALRLDMGLTQHQAADIIAKASGKPCSQTLVCQIELGNKYISQAQEERFITALKNHPLIA